MEYAIDSAPPIPKTNIERRRWWNQICIDALTEGIPSGCLTISKIMHCKLCDRCGHREDMRINRERAFIGFTSQEDF